MTIAAITGTYVLHEHLFPCQLGETAYVFLSAGGDPGATRRVADDALRERRHCAIVVVVAFVLWLVWVYP